MRSGCFKTHVGKESIFQEVVLIQTSALSNPCALFMYLSASCIDNLGLNNGILSK